RPETSTGAADKDSPRYELGQGLTSVFFDSSWLSAGLWAGFTTKARRREESPSLWLRLCRARFIGGFILAIYVDENSFRPARDFRRCGTDCTNLEQRQSRKKFLRVVKSVASSSGVNSFALLTAQRVSSAAARTFDRSS